MKHLGDITKIHGYDIEPVDVITFGSPCQGLSIAGQHAGLEDNRSVLFMDAVRIIKEMRWKTNGKYPTFAVWENVPGAYSSKKGEDFRTVLQEFAAACGSTDTIPRPHKRWAKAGCIMGDGWSIAWRTLGSQCWGVPQRRKRIFAVVDFGGQRAPEVLFKPESMYGHFTEGEKTWKTACGGTGNGTANANDVYPRVAGTLTARSADRGHTVVCVGGFVRRLTPLECERLQGYPDNWTKIEKISDMSEEEYTFWSDVWRTEQTVKGKSNPKVPIKPSLVKWYNRLDSDSRRYKACGNSIAVICAVRVLGGIADYLPQGATLGSLFDGIGGFPLAWSYVGGKTSWASEIEPLGIAVTKQNAMAGLCKDGGK